MKQIVLEIDQEGLTGCPSHGRCKALVATLLAVLDMAAPGDAAMDPYAKVLVLRNDWEVNAA